MALLARREAIAAVLWWDARGDALRCYVVDVQRSEELLQVELAMPRTAPRLSPSARA